MKKSQCKLFVALILSVMFVLSSCTAKSSSQQVELPSKDITFSIYSNAFYSNDLRGIDTEAMTEFQNYVNDTYNTNISFQSFGELPGILDGSKAGVASLEGNNILHCLNNGSILPLETYLNNNKIWNSLPESFKNLFYMNGHIWAIPTSDETITTVGYIRTDWLNAVSEKAPINTDEILQLSEAFKKGNPDGDQNDKNNYLTAGDIKYGFSEFILNSFGIYMYFNQSFIAYDPNMGCIVDSMFKPEAKQALEYLRKLIKDEMMDPYSLFDQVTVNQRVKDGKYGLISGKTIEGKFNAGAQVLRNLDLTDEANYEKAAQLYEVLPPLSEKKIAVEPNSLGYVLTKSTADPQEVVDTLLYLLFGSRQSYLTFCYGVPSHYDFTSSNGCVIKYKDSVNKTPYLYPTLVSASDTIMGKDFVSFMEDEKYSAALMLKKDAESYKSSYMSRYGESFVTVPALYAFDVEAYRKQIRPLFSAYNNLMKSLSSSEDIDSILKQYRDTAKECGIREILKESNALLDLPNKQVIE